MNRHSLVSLIFIASLSAVLVSIVVEEKKSIEILSENTSLSISSYEIAGSQ